MSTNILDCKDSLVEVGDYICFADSKLSGSHLYVGKVVEIRKTNKTVLIKIDQTVYETSMRWKYYDNKCYAICKI
jgi:hypothetical protein